MDPDTTDTVPTSAAFTHPRGWRLQVGKIAPTVFDFGAEYRAMLPEGVELAAVSQGTTSYDREEMAGTRDARFEAAALLDDWGVDAILAGGAPIAALEGADAEERFVAETNEKLDAEFTTSIVAAVDALRALDAHSIGVVTPFPDDRERETAAVFTESGFDVVATGGPSVPDTADVRGMSQTAAYRYCRRLVADTGERFDAVYVPCVPFGWVGHIDLLEEDLGCDVVMSAQAHVWKLLSLADVTPDDRSFGRLFREL